MFFTFSFSVSRFLFQKKCLSSSSSLYITEFTKFFITLSTVSVRMVLTLLRCVVKCRVGTVYLWVLCRYWQQVCQSMMSVWYEPSMQRMQFTMSS